MKTFTDYLNESQKFKIKKTFTDNKDHKFGSTFEEEMSFVNLSFAQKWVDQINKLNKEGKNSYSVELIG